MFPLGCSWLFHISLGIWTCSLQVNLDSSRTFWALQNAAYASLAASPQSLVLMGASCVALGNMSTPLAKLLAPELWIGNDGRTWK